MTEKVDQGGGNRGRGAQTPERSCEFEVLPGCACRIEIGSKMSLEQLAKIYLFVLVELYSEISESNEELKARE